MDSIQSQMSSAAAQRRDIFPEGTASAGNPADLVKFLQIEQLGEPVSPAITWTLNLNETPIYAILPEGFYVKDTYKALVRTLEEETTSASIAAAAAPPPAPAGRGRQPAKALPRRPSSGCRFPVS